MGSVVGQFLATVTVCLLFSHAPNSFADMEFIGQVGNKQFYKDDANPGNYLEAGVRCSRFSYTLARFDVEEELSFLMSIHAERLKRNYWMQAQLAGGTKNNLGCFVWGDWSKMPDFIRTTYWPDSLDGVGLQWLPAAFGSALVPTSHNQNGYPLCQKVLHENPPVPSDTCQYDGQLSCTTQCHWNGEDWSRINFYCPRDKLEKFDPVTGQCNKYGGC